MPETDMLKAVAERLAKALEEARKMTLDHVTDANRLAKERDEARAEVVEQARLLGMGGEREAQLVSEVERLRLLPSVENCRAERAMGNGGCGACALCCKEQREEIERLRGALEGLLAVHVVHTGASAAEVFNGWNAFSKAMSVARAALAPQKEKDDE